MCFIQHLYSTRITVHRVTPSDITEQGIHSEETQSDATLSRHRFSRLNPSEINTYFERQQSEASCSIHRHQACTSNSMTRIREIKVEAVHCSLRPHRVLPSHATATLMARYTKPLRNLPRVYVSPPFQSLKHSGRQSAVQSGR